MLTGVWPHYLKAEIITPVPKVSQPETVNDLRPIANLLNMKYVVKHKSAKLFMTYAVGTLEAALNMNHLILSTSSQRVS